ncbi:MAG: 30S ribosomal protein S6 [Thermoanaerobaculia bacterium]|nr:30S ribosomal protein S6 [Thermoanaerobaculia bacterium]MCZ7650779.1 30S ribosomal protein S6 [Thermoanaerobaculia bacterium]
MRTYELVFIADPRLSDEEVVALTDEYKQLITTRGATVQREESWGRRKLAYPIQKLNEGRYVVLYIEVEGKNPLPEVELRLRQNDKILRYLTVRTDQDRKPAVDPAAAAAAAGETAEPEAGEEA